MNGYHGFDAAFMITNVPTMPIAAAVTYGGMVNTFAPELLVDMKIMRR
jgi:hypothetical protein